MTDRAHMPKDTKVANLLCFEELIEANDDRFEWPSFDETRPRRCAYTSGTTGNPKGVLSATARPCCTRSRSRCPMR